MNTLQKALQEYLAMRRALGFQLLDAGPALSDFVSFLKRRRTSHITIRLALEWAQKPGAQPARWAHRLGFVRGFARYRSATDPRTEIPPWRLLPFRSKRARPSNRPLTFSSLPNGELDWTRTTSAERSMLCRGR